MIIGNGLIAKSLQDTSGVVYFASGVSNSQETRESEFERERNLLKIYTDNPIVYFSTTPKNNSPYMLHKQNMERLVMESNGWTILRVQYICGSGGNPSNMLNYLKHQIRQGNELNLYDCERTLLDVDDLALMVGFMPCGLHALYGIEPMHLVDIAELIAKRMNKKLTYKLIPCDEVKSQNSEYFEKAIDRLGIKRKGYNKKVIDKYGN